MSWRTRREGRGGRGSARVLEGATLARVAGAEGAVSAVRRAVARVELERPVGRLGIAAVGERGVAEAVVAALRPERDVVVGTVEEVTGADLVVAIAPASLPAEGVVEQVRALGDTLLGVVIVAEAAGAEEPPEQAPTPEATRTQDDALDALAALERAAGVDGEPIVAAAAPRRPALPAEDDSRIPRLEAELERRLADLERRENAFRKISQVVAQRGAGGARPPEVAAAIERAARAEARASELEERVRALQLRVTELEGRAPAYEPPRQPVMPTIQQLERAVAEAFDRGEPDAEERSFYLPLLRERAAADGTLPAEFSSLVESVFGRRSASE